MILKWKRQEPGYYLSTNDRWMIINEDRDWRLFDRKADDDEVLLAKQKQVCQQKAQSIEDNATKKKTPPVRKKKTPPKRPGKPVGKKVDREARVLVVNKVIETDDSVAGSLVSLYLEVSGLRFSLERTLHSVEHVENALQKIVDPDGTIPRAGKQ